jgi:hypothetical protein
VFLARRRAATVAPATRVRSQVRRMAQCCSVQLVPTAYLEPHRAATAAPATRVRSKARRTAQSSCVLPVNSACLVQCRVPAAG